LKIGNQKVGHFKQAYRHKEVILNNWIFLLLRFFNKFSHQVKKTRILECEGQISKSFPLSKNVFQNFIIYSYFHIYLIYLYLVTLSLKLT